MELKGNREVTKDGLKKSKLTAENEKYLKSAVSDFKARAGSRKMVNSDEERMTPRRSTLRCE